MNITHTILADVSTGISDLKKNPMAELVRERQNLPTIKIDVNDL